MAYEGAYPNLNQPGVYQPYPSAPQYGAYPPPYQPQGVHYEGGMNHELNQPLISHKKKSHEHSKGRKRVKIGLLILFIGFSIEIAVLVYSLYYSYLYEYCYWDFNLFSYKKDVDMTLAVADDKGLIDSLYYDFNCSGESIYPECPDLCHLVYNLELRQIQVIYCLQATGVFYFCAFLIFLVAGCCRTTKLKRPVAGILVFLSFISVIVGAVVYVTEYEFYEVKRDPVESETEGIDDPNDLDFEKGSYYMGALLVFMLIIRIIVTSILK